jgi:protein gp37
MGKNSGIEWTHHTFNPWWGCVKVSPACKHCYAESWSKRVGSQVWGAKAERRFFSETHWKQPLAWNREAEKVGERRRVFCASMADVFEDRDDLDSWRSRIWELVDQTPYLDWLLLTKRPENAASMVPWRLDWPVNVWLGATAESQVWADRRIPIILKVPARVRFLSCEPLLGPVSLAKWLSNEHCLVGPGGSAAGDATGSKRLIHWVIAGGESGKGARPIHPAWVRQLRDQCLKAGIAFHFKQWGNWRPIEEYGQLTIRQNASGFKSHLVSYQNLGKKRAGRDLDGRNWDELPLVSCSRGS